MKALIQNIIALAQSRVGRVIVVIAGLGGLSVLLHHLGGGDVWGAVTKAAVLLPFLIAIDGVIILVELWALRLLYGADRHRVPLSRMVRAGLIGYAVMCLVPAGRAVCEAAKAAILSRHTSAARAAAAATQFQGVTLVANALITIPCVIGALLTVGPTYLPLAISANFFLCMVGGSAVLLVGRFSRFGAWLGRRSKRAAGFGEAFDQHLQGEPTFPTIPIAWCVFARCFEVLRSVLLVYFVGGPLRLTAGLTSQGIHLIGTALGDLIPGQLGATEGTFTLMSQALHLRPTDAIAIPLLTHLAQVFWVFVGVLVPLVWTGGPVEAAAPVVLPIVSAESEP